MTRYIIVTENGTYVGPFDTRDDAESYASDETNIVGLWDIAELEEPVFED